MTSDFALSLSFDGIALLHRVQDGWHRVGTVDLASDDLAADMAALRATAETLTDGDLHTRLILPHDQIRFMTIETARTTLDDVHAAIAEATPLALDEMVIDFERSGGRTYIAAVAKQTLEEAEGFATEHGFAPISFVANAEPYTFTSEVFFGPTQLARDGLGIAADVMRDTAPAVETGVIAALAEEAITAEPEVAVTQPVFASRKRAEVTPAKSVPSATPDIDTPIARFNRSTQSTDKAPEPALPVEAPTPQSPATAAAPRTMAKAPRAPKRSLLARGRKPVPAPKPVSRTDAALARGVASVEPAGKSRYLGLSLTTALVAAIALVGFWANRQVDGGVAGLLAVDPGLQEDTIAADTAPVVTAPVVEAPAEPVVAETVPAPEPIVEEEPPTPIVTAIPGRVLSPADAARIYAATGVWQRAPRLPGEPKETDQGDLFGLHEFAVVAPVDDLTRSSGPADVANVYDLPIIAPLNPAPANRPLPRDEDGFVLASATGTILPTGVPIYGRAPDRTPPIRPTDEPVGLDDSSLPVIPEDIVTEIQFVAYLPESDVPFTEAFRSPALTQPIPVLRPDAEAPEGLAGAKFITALPPAAPLEPGPAIADSVAAEPITPEAGENATPVATAVETAPDQSAPVTTVAATADAPPAVTATPGSESDLFDAPVDFVEVIQGRPAVVPPLRPGTPEVAPETDLAEAPDATPETVVDDTALSDAEVAEAPDAQIVETPLFQDPELAGFRPSARPADLLPPSAATFEAIPALAGARPSLRPEGLAPETESAVATAVADALEAEDPAVANTNDISAIVASIAAAAPPSQIVTPTQRAIVASPRPDLRPQNFSRVVAAAQSLQQRQQTRAVAASTSAAVAQAPAPATAPATGGQTAVTVARAATVDNAIRLRDMNLIGVYGKPGARRALVRMPNGRFVKVEVGSSLDGGRVTAIGDSALNFVKRGQTYALQLPAG